MSTVEPSDNMDNKINGLTVLEFKQLLRCRNSAVTKGFLQFMKQQHAHENVLFWWDVDAYQLLYEKYGVESTKVQAACLYIYDTFIEQGSEMEVNIDEHTWNQITQKIQSLRLAVVDKTIPIRMPPIDLFFSAQAVVFKMMHLDCVPRFLIYIGCQKLDDYICPVTAPPLHAPSSWHSYNSSKSNCNSNEFDEFGEKILSEDGNEMTESCGSPLAFHFQENKNTEPLNRSKQSRLLGLDDEKVQMASNYPTLLWLTSPNDEVTKRSSGSFLGDKIRFLRHAAYPTMAYEGVIDCLRSKNNASHDLEPHDLADLHEHVILEDASMLNNDQAVDFPSTVPDLYSSADAVSGHNSDTESILSDSKSEAIMPLRVPKRRNSLQSCQVPEPYSRLSSDACSTSSSTASNSSSSPLTASNFPSETPKQTSDDQFNTSQVKDRTTLRSHVRRFVSSARPSMHTSTNTSSESTEKSVINSRSISSLPRGGSRLFDRIVFSGAGDYLSKLEMPNYTRKGSWDDELRSPGNINAVKVPMNIPGKAAHLLGIISDQVPINTPVKAAMILGHSR